MLGKFYHTEDHPRVCGEHGDDVLDHDSPFGSSPRMRGARRSDKSHKPAVGIIPAYAGSTWPRCPHPRTTRDHPRVCGEHATVLSCTRGTLGSSPRMRGARPQYHEDEDSYRIIPAYAGSTNRSHDRALASWDHPRVCGEHRLSACLST